jgi:uncharacterized membrane protein
MIPLLSVLHWRPQLDPWGCGVVLAGSGLWLWWLHRRWLQRVTPRRARLLLGPKLGLLTLLLVALFEPVSTVEKKEAVNGKLLAAIDTSSSMEVADDGRESRLARAQAIVRNWKGALPAGVTLDLVEFDTAVVNPRPLPAAPGLRGTDLAACLLSLAERPDLAAYLGVVLLTDGGDESIESAALPGAPLSIIGIGTDPARWNDVAITGVQCPPAVEKDVDFEISVDLQAHAGGGGAFANSLNRVRVLLERQVPSGWENASEQTADLTSLRARAKFSVPAKTLGAQCYRLSTPALDGELSDLNNARRVNVDVQKKSLRILYFTEELGQEFRMLRHEIGRDPGMAFTALLRSTPTQYQLQGTPLPGEDGLMRGFPSHKKELEIYDAIIVGAVPAKDETPEQMQALAQYVADGGVAVFLGGDLSFGRGGYAPTALAPLFPWRISENEGQPVRGAFPALIPPGSRGHPILATVEELLAPAGATIDSVNQVLELKAGATGLIQARLPQAVVPVAAVQPYGKGKVLGIASNTLWKWATQNESLRSAYGLFWRQALRLLTGKTAGGQNILVKWDREFYRPGEEAQGTLQVISPDHHVRFSASCMVRGQVLPITVEPRGGQADAFGVQWRFRERGDHLFRLVAYENERVWETYEKSFAVAPLAPEGSRLELDTAFLKRLAERGGGSFLTENEAPSFMRRFTGSLVRKTTVTESPLIESGPWFILAVLSMLLLEWALRRRMNLL